MGNMFQNQHCKITLSQKGSETRQKISYPIHCGIYTDVTINGCRLHFNQNQEIIRIHPAPNAWCHPHEWLKRTKGNDWVYYSAGGYTGVFEATGEYYLPNFNYSSNNILGGHPFRQEEVEETTNGWYILLKTLEKTVEEFPAEVGSFIKKAIQNSPAVLAEKANTLHDIIGGPVSVLPPDARHSDYDVIPLTISRGCLYKCKFCKVKNNLGFKELSHHEINLQLKKLRALYQDDLINYNSLFLGEHDALQSSPKLILEAIECADAMLGMSRSYIASPAIYTFGSISSLLGTPDHFFHQLNELPFMTYINIGFESADQATLDVLGKPLTEKLIYEGFQKMQEINGRFERIELTGNFVMDDDLPDGHYSSILNLLRESLPHTKPKGSIYFSPLRFDTPSRKQLFAFNRLKVASRLPTYLYIIQRL